MLKMLTPTMMLWLYAIATGIATAVSPEGSSFGNVQLVARVALALIIASWVASDAKKRQKQLCYDYDSFIFFAWPIVVPVYLFKTRGWRAFLTLFCFAGICIVAMLVAASILLLREFVSR
jgi:hypothetical protein